LNKAWPEKYAKTKGLNKSEMLMHLADGCDELLCLLRLFVCCCCEFSSTLSSDMMQANAYPAVCLGKKHTVRRHTHFLPVFFHFTNVPIHITSPRQGFLEKSCSFLFMWVRHVRVWVDEEGENVNTSIQSKKFSETLRSALVVLVNERILTFGSFATQWDQRKTRVNCVKKNFLTQPQALTKLTQKQPGEKRERKFLESGTQHFSLQLLFDFDSSWFSLRSFCARFDRLSREKAPKLWK
jgi:hypothetical protein